MTNLVKRIVFGGASISGEGAGYGFGDISEDSSLALVRHAFDRGIRFFDTAPIYGYGQSEKRLGQALASCREQVFISSKAGIDWHASKRVNLTNEPSVILRMFDESRKRLNSDYIDLYMLHYPDPRVDIRAAMDVLLTLKSENKISSIGLCNTNSADLSKCSEVEYLQSEVNLFSNKLEALDTKNRKTMGWGTFDKGILSGRVDHNRIFDKSDCRSWAPWWKKGGWKQRVERAQVMQTQIAPKLLKHHALEYSLKSCDYTMVGMRSIEQVNSLLDLL